MVTVRNRDTKERPRVKINELGDILEKKFMDNRETLPETLDQRLAILVKTAENLQPAYKQMKPGDANYTKFADFINPVLQLKQQWNDLSENTRMEILGMLEDVFKKMIDESPTS